MSTKLPNKVIPFMFHFMRDHKYAFLLFYLIPFIAIIDCIIIPYILKTVIDDISTPNFTGSRFDQVGPPMFLSAALFGIMCYAFRVQNYVQTITFPKFEASIRMAAFKQLTNQSYSFFANNASGKIVNKINDLPRSLQVIGGIFCWNILQFFIIAIGTIIMFYQINPKFATITIVWVGFAIISCLYLSKFIKKSSEENAESKSHLTGSMVDSISNIQSLKLFAFLKNDFNSVMKDQNQEIKTNHKFMFRQNLYRLSLDTIVVITFFIMAYLFASEWDKGNLTVGELVFIFNCHFTIMFNLWHISHSFSELFANFGIAQVAINILNEPVTITDIKGAKDLVVTKGKIEFKDVNFCYDNNQILFKGKSLTIEAGEKIGLVGFTGSGKSSFVNLILRFYDVDSGQILIDNQEIAKVKQDSLRRQIMMIPQDINLFHRTILENIGIGNANASEEEIKLAAKKAYCTDFIEDLPDGFNTLIGERGIKLSGGQRQRIAIARAFLKNAPILILDEATSALDSIYEKKIQESLEKLMKGKTTIVIAHRLSTLAEMDRILVFDKGQIAEQGSHQSLLRKSGHYRKMWDMQIGGYMPDSI